MNVVFNTMPTPNSISHHLSEDSLERYLLGGIRNQAEFAVVEEHLLYCEDCITSCERLTQYLDILRVALREVLSA